MIWFNKYTLYKLHRAYKIYTTETRKKYYKIITNLQLEQQLIEKY